MPTPAPPPFMMKPQVPDPHAVATDNKNVSTVPVFRPDAAQCPVVTSLTPNTAVHNVATLITVKGSGFEKGSAIVTGNAGDATSATYVDPTTMYFVTRPDSQVGVAAVYVRNVNGIRSEDANLTFT